MLHLVTGVPGATKTAFVVTKLDAIEKSNKVNLVKNIEFYNHNKNLMEKFAHDFTYREYEDGSGHELKNKIEILPDDYFNFLGQEFDDLRPDYYFQRVVHFNEIIQRINEREGEQNFKFFLPVRTIYTNINNLKIDYARALTHDWRDCPDGSIVVIDEVQLVPPYDDIKTKDDPIVQSLTIHRHRGFDFYFITQYPSLLHPTVKVLIGVHYHLTRPYGMKTVVYQYGSAKDNPNAMVNKHNREAKFFLRLSNEFSNCTSLRRLTPIKSDYPKVFYFLLRGYCSALLFSFIKFFSPMILKNHH
ncbi:Zonula occludens toxin [Moraxella lacunata]|uniref:Zonula occludens toxin n=1 Tax=Moraxella lacunata TaxID=477 RepID=A0A378TUV6_MORLA|nr:zonular occludens toxin domain-containing protein [Moraxella lacunata]STZ63513.1 Zonula occludens toxin [Moraxella lacunata]